MESGKLFAVFMDLHLSALKLIQLLTDSSLISGSEPGPGFVCPPVVVFGVSDLHVFVKTQNPASYELCHRRPHTQLSGECPLNRLLGFSLLCYILMPEDVPLLQVLCGRSLAQAPGNTRVGSHTSLHTTEHYTDLGFLQLCILKELVL